MHRFQVIYVYNRSNTSLRFDLSTGFRLRKELRKALKVRSLVELSELGVRIVSAVTRRRAIYHASSVQERPLVPLALMMAYLLSLMRRLPIVNLTYFLDGACSFLQSSHDSLLAPFSSISAYLASPMRLLWSQQFSYSRASTSISSSSRGDNGATTS